MNELDQQQDVCSLFGGTYVPKVIEDSGSVDFSKPIKGKYECEVVEIRHAAGEKRDGSGDTWENLTLKLKATRDLEGDPSYNRFLDKTFWAGTNDWNDDEDKWKKDLCDCLYTAGLDLPATADVESFLALNDKIAGQKIFVSAYGNKNGKQVVRIVKELKVKEEDKANAMPFDLA